MCYSYPAKNRILLVFLLGLNKGVRRRHIAARNFDKVAAICNLSRVHALIACLKSTWEFLLVERPYKLLCGLHNILHTKFRGPNTFFKLVHADDLLLLSFVI